MRKEVGSKRGLNKRALKLGRGVQGPVVSFTYLQGREGSSRIRQNESGPHPTLRDTLLAYQERVRERPPNHTLAEEFKNRKEGHCYNRK